MASKHTGLLIRNKIGNDIKKSKYPIYVPNLKEKTIYICGHCYLESYNLKEITRHWDYCKERLKL